MRTKLWESDPFARVVGIRRSKVLKRGLCMRSEDDVQIAATVAGQRGTAMVIDAVAYVNGGRPRIRVMMKRGNHCPRNGVQPGYVGAVAERDNFIRIGVARRARRSAFGQQSCGCDRSGLNDPDAGANDENDQR